MTTLLNCGCGKRRKLLKLLTVFLAPSIALCDTMVVSAPVSVVLLAAMPVIRANWLEGDLATECGHHGCWVFVGESNRPPTKIQRF